MNVAETTPFLTILKKMYGIDNLEFQVPYKGAKGNYPAEIFNQHGLPSALFDKINALSLKMIGDQEIEKCSDHEVIASSCGYRGGTLQVIFTQTKALEIFEKSVRQDYDDYMQREKNDILSFSTASLADKYNIYKDSGPISAKQLCSKIPALKELITGSRRGLSIGNSDGPLELLAKNRSDLEKAEEIIKAEFVKNDYTKDYGVRFRIEKSNGLEVLGISSVALEDMKAILTKL